MMLLLIFERSDVYVLGLQRCVCVFYVSISKVTICIYLHNKKNTSISRVVSSKKLDKLVLLVKSKIKYCNNISK